MHSLEITKFEIMIIVSLAGLLLEVALGSACNSNGIVFIIFRLFDQCSNVYCILF